MAVKFKIKTQEYRQDDYIDKRVQKQAQLNYFENAWMVSKTKKRKTEITITSVSIVFTSGEGEGIVITKLLGF